MRFQLFSDFLTHFGTTEKMELTFFLCEKTIGLIVGVFRTYWSRFVKVSDFIYLFGHVGLETGRELLKGRCCIVGRKDALWKSEIGVKHFTNPTHHEHRTFRYLESQILI